MPDLIKVIAPTSPIVKYTTPPGAIVVDKGMKILVDGKEVLSKSETLNFEHGLTAEVGKNGDIDVEIKGQAPVPSGKHFAGIYKTLADLQDAIPTPTADLQAIVLTPSESYYEVQAQKWVELSPVGSINSGYVGLYDSIADLNAAVPSPLRSNMAIVGTDQFSIYAYTTKWNLVEHYTPAGSDAKYDALAKKVQTNTTGQVALKNRMNVAEGHLQTLQQQDIAMSDDITQLQSQVFTGIELEDDDGNSFADITGIAFDGATVQDDQGTGLATVVVNPKITVANGQQPDSTSVMGNALVFDGATVEVDPNDKDVIKVTLPSGSSDGINLGDGVNASREVKTVILRGHEAYGTGNTAEIHLEFAHFKTLTERDAWSTKFGSGMNFDTVAVVDADENGFVQWYKFNSATKAWVDYNAQGVVMSDSNGAIPKNIKTVVFGAGFSIQQAGDQEDAALVTYTGGTDGDGMTINGKHISDLTVMAPLQIDNSQSQDRLLVDPSAYEPMHSPSFLGKVGSLVEVKDGHDTTVYYNSPITPYGMYFSANDVLQGLNVQEDDGADPNLGGQLTELLVSVGFEGKAPKSGTVKLWLMYHQNGAFIPNGYVRNVNDKPMIIEKSFATGEDVKLILDGAYYAQGQETITVHIEHNFTDEFMIVDPEESLLCVNQYQSDTGSSLARVEFLRRNETQITPAFFNFDSPFVRMSSFLSGVNEPETEVNIGEGENFIAQFGITNLTKAKASVTNGVLSVGDNGVDIADFYIDYLVDNVRTSMMRGKTFSVGVRGNSINSAFNLALYTWNGKADEPSKIYSSRNNGTINVNAGWKEVEKVFIAEDPSGDPKNTSAEFVIPEDAVNVSFALIPVDSQQPLSITIEDFTIDPKSSFIGYVAIEKHDLRTIHLNTRDDYLELGQNSEGYASLRYTINYSPISGLPMPVGAKIKGKAEYTLDKTKNVVAGSSATGGEGAIVWPASGQISLSCDYLLWNEQSSDTVVDVWWVLYDVDGNESKIAGSDIQFTVPKQSTSHGIPKLQPAFVFEIEKGQAFALRASANKADGAYLESTRKTDYMVRPVIDFKELVVDASDDPDLVSVALSKSLVVDRRYHEFIGNSAQNITISDFVIPSDVVLSNVTAERMTATGYSSIDEVQHSYNSNTQVMTVHVGGVSDGIVFFEFWSK